MAWLMITLGGFSRKKMGRLLGGRTRDKMPVAARKGGKLAFPLDMSKSVNQDVRSALLRLLTCCGALKSNHDT